MQGFSNNHEVTNSRVAASLRYCYSALRRLPGEAAAVAAAAEARRLRRRGGVLLALPAPSAAAARFCDLVGARFFHFFPAGSTYKRVGKVCLPDFPAQLLTEQNSRELGLLPALQEGNPVVFSTHPAATVTFVTVTV